MKRIILASKVVLISCMLLACTAGDEISSKASQGPFYIVIVAPFSGPLSRLGRLMLRRGGMRLAKNMSGHLHWLQLAIEGGLVVS